MTDGQRIGVLVMNFGEPPEPTPESVEPFLEAIFLQNADLEPSEEATTRARELARDRAPALVDEYRSIGGSPLNAQADAQAEALQAALRSRGHDAFTYSGFQFTPPSIAHQVAAARDDGVHLLVGLPLYPICGPSTSGAALRSVRRALDALAWSPRFIGISGWHHHPAYTALRADAVRAFTREHGIDLTADDVLLYFSVHGTPLKYLYEGHRYGRYVEEHTARVAELLEAPHHVVGFQNHRNRDVAWTQPDNEALLGLVEQRRLVVVPISFMHEQSETLAELDGTFRDACLTRGKEYHRVPVPHDAPPFIDFLADLVEALASDADRSPMLSRCRCVAVADTWCTNGRRDLPASPFVPDLRP